MCLISSNLERHQTRKISERVSLASLSCLYVICLYQRSSVFTHWCLWIWKAVRWLPRFWTRKIEMQRDLLNLIQEARKPKILKLQLKPEQTLELRVCKLSMLTIIRFDCHFDGLIFEILSWLTWTESRSDSIEHLICFLSKYSTLRIENHKSIWKAGLLIARTFYRLVDRQANSINCPFCSVDKHLSQLKYSKLWRLYLSDCGA